MTEEDNAGYKRPPKSLRFKTGQSGNPRGRPKGSNNLKTDLNKLMQKRITVREGGEVRHVSGQEAMLLSMFEKAVRGDPKASSQMIAMLMKLESGVPPPPELPNVSENDRAIIKEFLRRNSPSNEKDQP